MKIRMLSFAFLMFLGVGIGEAKAGAFKTLATDVALGTFGYLYYQGVRSAVIEYLCSEKSSEEALACIARNNEMIGVRYTAFIVAINPWHLADGFGYMFPIRLVRNLLKAPSDRDSEKYNS